MKYDKQPFTPEQAIQLLEKRGLNIPNSDRAIKYLNYVGYFRLTGYMFHLQKPDGSHEFREGVTFNDVIRYYHFDNKLRILLLEYIERIEVSLRAMLSNKYSLNYGFYWYTQYSQYKDKAFYIRINDYVKEYFTDPQEDYLKSFKRKYTGKTLPPSNMAMEILTFGNLSKLFQALAKGVELQTIVKEFGLPTVEILSSWLIRITNIRNICAHHSRLWNRSFFGPRPIYPTRKKYGFNGNLTEEAKNRLYGALLMLDRLLSHINPTNSFTEKVSKLIEEYGITDTDLMGFPVNWKTISPWT